MPAHHPIAVVGAGLGGLALASVLHRHGVEAAVYELERSPDARGQGGMLDLHRESGQAALRAAGLHEQFRAVVHPGGEAMRIVDKHGTVHLEDDGEDTGDRDGGDRPEIKRTDLRRILLGSLPDGLIRWGAKVTGARSLGDGRHEVALDGGDSFTTELLIGADGTWSRVRPLLSEASPVYSGVSFVESDLRDPALRHPRTAELVGTGMMFALAERKGFLTHVESDGTLHAYVAVQAPETWLGDIDFADVTAAKATLLELFDGWDGRLLALIADADGPLIPRPIHALPVGHAWRRTPGVTLVGDAAHVMSPFAGEGANLAMFDGTELAAAIVGHPGDTEAALQAYEQAMFPRAEAAAAATAASLAMCFGPDAMRNLIVQMSRHQASPEA